MALTKAELAKTNAIGYVDETAVTGDVKVLFKY